MVLVFLSSVVRRLGVDRMWRRYENRRQSAIPVPLVIQAIQFAISAFQKIPVERMMT